MDIVVTVVGFLLISSSMYLVGRCFVVLLKLQLTLIEDFFYSTVLGILLYTLTAYVFLTLGISALLLPATIFISVFTLLKIRGTHTGVSLNDHKISLIIVGIFSFIFSLIMELTGKWGQSLVYRHDDTWHIALINELKVHFPPNNPGFAGVPLHGYHFFYDLFAAMLSNTFHFSALTLHFHILPLLFALLLGLGTYTFMYRWRKSRAVAVLAVFLVMFGGGSAYLILPFIHTPISLDNGLGMLQPANTLYNPPLAISLIIILFSLYSLLQYYLKKENNWLIPLLFAVGLLPMFKIYAGIVLCIGFSVFIVLSLFRKKFLPIAVGLGAGLLIMITYGAFADKTSSIIFYPFWGPHTLLQSVGIYDFATKHAVTKNIVTILHRLGIELFGLALFIVGNLGTRYIGLFGIRKRELNTPREFIIVLASMGVLSLLLPLLFIQSLKEFEIIQFASYYLFIVSLFGSIGLYALYQRITNHAVCAIAVVAFVLLTIPSAYVQFRLLPALIQNKTFLQSPTMQAMHFLSTQGHYDDTVLELPRRQAIITDPNLTDWYSTLTPTIPAFVNKRGFVNNEFIEFPNLPVKPRIELVKQVINTQSRTSEHIHATEDELRKNKIRYIYMTTDISELLQSKYIHTIFHNQDVTIYEVNFN